MSELTTLNNFEENAAGVFLNVGDASRTFGYSDGESTEYYLNSVLDEAEDLASDSTELHGKIIDWPSEYHLSGLRSNLIKALNLDSAKRVLELGCGCGAISRYLGELGLEVDAVEGSPIRAQLAAKRCRDLPNVTVSTANFNELELPVGHYDAVLYIGVTEYAGRFSDAPTDQQAVIDMLSNARRAIRPDGVVVIAIENRLGIKYLLGADEDHYGKPFVGILNYPDKEGMRTYSYQEWKELLSASDLPNSRFLLPFPDYKVPTMIVDENVGTSGCESQIDFEKIRSLDYTSDFSIGNDEPYLWQGIMQGGSLKTFANSYLIVCSMDQDACHKTVKLDAIKFNDFRSEYPNNEYTNYLKVKAECEKQNGWQVLSQLAKKDDQISALKSDISKVRKTIGSMSSSRVWRILTRLDRIFKSIGLKR
jgi:SAM-dependent methyltransferase